jgi:hypothetical protein
MTEMCVTEEAVFTSCEFRYESGTTKMLIFYVTLGSNYGDPHEKVYHVNTE